jgi:hypothetical protein
MATRIATGSLETDLQWPSTAIDHGTIQCSDGSPSIFEACEIDESKAFAFGGVVVANGFDIGDGTERSKQSIECRIISFSRQIVYKHTEWSGSCRHTRTERERERERERVSTRASGIRLIVGRWKRTLLLQTRKHGWIQWRHKGRLIRCSGSRKWICCKHALRNSSLICSYCSSCARRNRGCTIPRAEACIG